MPLEEHNLIDDYNNLLKKYNKLEKRIASIMKLNDKQFKYQIKEIENHLETQHRVTRIINQSDREAKKVLDVKFLLEDTLKEEQKQKREIEALLIQQSKMAAVGEMLENITHQMKQPLNVINILASDLQLKLNLEEPITNDNLHSSVDSILQSVAYITNTISDFKDFFNNKKIKKDFYIEETIEKTIQLISAKIKKMNVTFVKNIDNITIHGVENELIQVFMNLFSNSLDALTNIDHDKYIFIDVYKKEQQTIIEIKDNAGGIKIEDNIDKIFESHFTTKDTNGTGIGLYMCKNIIEHTFKSKLDVKNITFDYNNCQYTGALFTITIPQ